MGEFNGRDSWVERSRGHGREGRDDGERERRRERISWMRICRGEGNGWAVRGRFW